MSKKLHQTPSQTVGPYFAYGLAPSQYGYPFLRSLFTPVVAQPQAAGEHIRLVGQVYDGAGKTINDALVEIHQRNARGELMQSPVQVKAEGFTGFGRCGTGTLAGDCYEFFTVKPGAIDPAQAPFIDVCVTARGLLLHVFSRIYFEDEAAANAKDKAFMSVPADRRHTLVAQRQQTPAGIQYRFDIRMQDSARGRETVFFDL
ncbi:MAG: protocatechuate 3,4-dioxygenase subunit alpha [Betaproteobacteria bacterium]|nr:protocatechuate 3,4-dioxygenase subunit alpha [Betaproteobacteria bacterium]